MQIDIITYHKKLGNFRQISSIKKVDICKIVENFEAFPLYADMMKLYDAVYPGLFHKCPYDVTFFLNSEGFLF